MSEETWLVPLTLAVMVGLFGWWGNSRLRQTLEAELSEDLNETIEANVTALEIWVTNQLRIATSLADDPPVRAAAARILDVPLEAQPDAQELMDRDEFGNYVRPRLLRFGYQVAQLVNTNFTIAAHSGRGRLGIGLPVSDAHTNKFAELFATGQPVVITPFKPELLVQRRQRRPSPSPGSVGARNRRGDITLMQVAAPVRIEGVLRGALALIVDPDKEFTRILSVARSGATGDTYAFDQTGLLISRSRFDSQLKALGLLESTNGSSALNLKLYDPEGDLTREFKPADKEPAARPLVHLCAAAVTGGNGVEVQPSRDFRGVPVVGAWRWLPQLEIGIVTQIDASDAYHPLRVLQWLFIALFLVLLLCACGLFLFTYASLAWRRRLNEAELRLKQLGQYALEEKIGEGGMGVVYRARHALLRRETAVKLLLPDRADAAAIERFEREVRLTCQLTHPNTVQVFDYGHTPEGIFYYVMEFLDGVNLHELVTLHGVQPEGRVIHILAQVCDSLAEAHALGMVHRDVKPANVFLCNRGGIPDCVKVLDFGLVKEYGRPSDSESAAPEANAFAGTPSFMAPESFKDPERSDPRSDIYAIGVLAYFLLTGSYAFDGSSAEEIYEMQVGTEPVPPNQRGDNPVSPELERIILQCLDKDPDRRPLTALKLRSLLLASPRAGEWTVETARAWWTEHSPPSAPAPAAAEASSIPTLQVDIASRAE